MSNLPLLEVKNISRYFLRSSGFLAKESTVKAVDNVSFTLKAKTTLGLVGESGSGKSTVARIISRLLTPSAGNVYFNGVPLFNSVAGVKANTTTTCNTGPNYTAPANNTANSDFTAASNCAPAPDYAAANNGQFLRSFSSKLQMVFQDPYSSLNPRLKIGYSIAEPLICAGMPRKETAAKVATLLQQVGLNATDAKRYPHEFSGGQRQRIALARALAPKPDIIICDEPVSSLDASVQAQVLNLLKDSQESLGLAYLFISHDLAVVSHMSDYVAVMYLGRIVESAPADELFSNPLHPYTQMLIEASGAYGGGGQSYNSAANNNFIPCKGEVAAAYTPVTANTNIAPLTEAVVAGCAFAPRCARRKAECMFAAPELKENNGHSVSCLWF